MPKGCPKTISTKKPDRNARKIFLLDGKAMAQ